MSIARFMASPVGRGVRVAAGVVLIVIGLAAGGAVGWVVAIIGLVPLLAGVFNVCMIAPLIKAPFNGKEALGTKH